MQTLEKLRNISRPSRFSFLPKSENPRFGPATVRPPSKDPKPKKSWPWPGSRSPARGVHAEENVRQQLVGREMIRSQPRSHVTRPKLIRLEEADRPDVEFHQHARPRRPATHIQHQNACPIHGTRSAAVPTRGWPSVRSDQYGVIQPVRDWKKLRSAKDRAPT